MGIFSWLRFRRRADQPERTHSLVRYQYDDPKLESLRRAVAEDIAEVEEGDRHHGGDTTPDER